MLTWSGKLRIACEMHCEECNDIVHHHFDCPICGEKRAGTNCYHDVRGDPPPHRLGCESCLAEFTTDAADFYDGDAVWTRVTAPGKMDHG